MSNIVYNLREISEAASFLLSHSASKVLCFTGDLGAGKTTLIKAFVRKLGGADAGSSPTFGLVNEYRDRDGNLLGYHLDCYRIRDEEEALDFGVEEYLYADCWVFVEWPEKISALLPPGHTDIHIRREGPESRGLSIHNRT